MLLKTHIFCLRFIFSFPFDYVADVFFNIL